MFENITSFSIQVAIAGITIVATLLSGLSNQLKKGVIGGAISYGAYIVHSLGFPIIDYTGVIKELEILPIMAVLLSIYAALQFYKAERN